MDDRRGALRPVRYVACVIDGKEGEIEVRQLFEPEDFDPGEAIERFRDMEIGSN